MFLQICSPFHIPENIISNLCLSPQTSLHSVFLIDSFQRTQKPTDGNNLNFLPTNLETNLLLYPLLLLPSHYDLLEVFLLLSRAVLSSPCNLLPLRQLSSSVPSSVFNFFPPVLAHQPERVAHLAFHLFACNLMHSLRLSPIPATPLPTS